MNGQDFKLSQIKVVMLGVRDLDQSVAFYRDRLGLALQNRSEGFAFFEAGGLTLALSRPLAEAISPTKGATEIVFGVEHVRTAYAALCAKGVAFTIEPRVVTGTLWAANFSDPEGHNLSIFGPE